MLQVLALLILIVPQLIIHKQRPLALRQQYHWLHYQIAFDREKVAAFTSRPSYSIPVSWRN